MSGGSRSSPVNAQQSTANISTIPRLPLVSNFALIGVSVLLVLWILIPRTNTKRAEALFEQTHDCGGGRPLLYKWPLAIDLVLDAFRNIKEKRILQWFLELFEQTGPTFEQKILGSTSIDTIDPNLESILSTNFSTYGLGARRPTFAPLLGDGIFTQDAAVWKHSRDMLWPLFSLNRANIFTQIKTHTEHLVNCILTDELIDLQLLFFRFTFDTIRAISSSGELGLLRISIITSQYLTTPLDADVEISSKAFREILQEVIDCRDKVSQSHKMTFNVKMSILIHISNSASITVMIMLRLPPKKKGAEL
ncbi:hypothetical protein BDZ45DRAFT_802579 [Acephala macrosclerotiorum]|nr:hypothetical protein BDZ45DRAFT_802579 [Acephala macrosclerotiorum]